MIMAEIQLEWKFSFINTANQGLTVAGVENKSSEYILGATVGPINPIALLIEHKVLVSYKMSNSNI